MLSAAAVADGLSDPPPAAVAAHKLLRDGALHRVCLLCSKQTSPPRGKAKCQRGGGSFMQQGHCSRHTSCLTLAVVG